MLTNRKHIIALKPLDKGLMAKLLRYPYEVSDPAEYFGEIQDVKVTKDMLDLARHIVDQNPDPSNLPAIGISISLLTCRRLLGFLDWLLRSPALRRCAADGLA